VAKVVEPATEPIAEPVTEPVAEVWEPRTEPVSEVVEFATGRVAENVEPATEPVTEVLAPAQETVERAVESIAEATHSAIRVFRVAIEPSVELDEGSMTSLAALLPAAVSTPESLENIAPAAVPNLPPVAVAVAHDVAAAVPSAPDGSSMVAALDLEAASPGACGSVAGAENITSWASAAVGHGADEGDAAGPSRTHVQDRDKGSTPPSAPSAPGSPSAPSAPAQGPASVSGPGGLVSSLAVLDDSDFGAAISADRFAAGDDTVPHGRAALIRIWPG
jgi:hypothetical protein